MGFTISDAMLDISGYSKKGAVVMPNGNVVWIAPKTTTSFRVYESTDRATATVKANITVAALPTGAVYYNVQIGHDGTYIVLSYKCADNSIRTRIITYAGWAVAAEQTAYPATAGIVPNSFDLDISPGGAIILAAMYAGGTNDKVGYLVRIRTTAGNWVAVSKTTLHATATTKTYTWAMSVGWFRTASATARRFTVMPAWGGTAADTGVRHLHCSINETDGSAFSIQDLGIMDYGKMDYVSTDAFSDAARKIMTVGLVGQPNFMAVGMNVASKIAGPGSTIVPTHTAGIIKISAPGVNAAADVLERNFQSSQVTDLAMELANGPGSITFAYDGDGNPSFNMIQAVGTPIFIRYGTSRTKFFLSRVLAIANPLTATPQVMIRRGGQWDNNAQARVALLGSTSVDYANKRHDMLLQYASSLNMSLSFAPLHKATAVKPAAGAVVASSKPTVGGTVTVPANNNKVPTDFYGKYTVATDSGFTAGLITFFGTVKTYGTYATTGVTSYSIEDQWTGAPIPSGTRYIKFTPVDVYGNEGTSFWTTSAFTIAHPASAKNVKPEYSATDPLSFPYDDPGAVGYSLHYVSWELSDAWNEDYQTAYQLQVFDTETGTMVWDSGKIISGNKNAQIRVPFASKNKLLYFVVSLWDRYDQTAGPVGYGALIVYTSSSVDTLVPLTVDGGGNVNSNAPSFSYTVTDGFYDTASLDVTITRGQATLAALSIPNPPDAGTIQFPSILENNTDYTVTAAAVDTAGLRKSRVIQIHTTWTPPAAPSGVAVDLSHYNVENESYVEISWTDATKDVDWIGWNIYRQVDQINPSTQAVVETGELEFLANTTVDGTVMTFHDSTAPSAVRVGYVVRQVVNRLGAIIESVNTAQTAAFPVSDGYWLIDPSPEDPFNSSFRLWSVITDDYTHKYESQMTHIIGRGNHEDRGDDLGREGSIVAQLRDNTAGTARVKRRRIEQMKDEARSLYLRNPFGDVWPVSVGDIGVGRIAGVGLAEFCDLTIPYTEVY